MIDSPDAPNCPAPPEAAGAPRDDRDAPRAEPDQAIEALTAQLEEARLLVLWQRAEIAARDQRIADLWEQADGLNRAVAALSAERDALRAQPAGLGPTADGQPRLSWFGRAARRRKGAEAGGTTGIGDGGQPRRVA